MAQRRCFQVKFQLKVTKGKVELTKWCRRYLNREMAVLRTKYKLRIRCWGFLECMRSNKNGFIAGDNVADNAKTIIFSVFRDKMYLHHMRMLKLLSSPFSSQKKVKQTLTSYKYFEINRSEPFTVRKCKRKPRVTLLLVVSTNLYVLRKVWKIN